MSKLDLLTSVYLVGGEECIRKERADMLWQEEEINDHTNRNADRYPGVLFRMVP